jgi:thiamine biosynthesis lipoprotein
LKRIPQTIGLLLFIFLGSCEQQSIYHRQFLSFGTLIDITITAHNLNDVENAFSALQSDFDTMHHQWHAWQTSRLTHLNAQLASGQIFHIDPTLTPLVKKARTLSQRSLYLFNPAVGKLIALWGFHQDDPGRTQPPTPSDIAKLVKSHPTLDDITLDNGTAHCLNPDVQLDFGGFAKGYGVGLAANHLLKMGQHNFIINAGGDLIVHGNHPRHQWNIGIRDPKGGNAIASVKAFSGEAIFTSGDYERFYLQDGKKRHHIIDPRTGYPAQGARAVTVIHNDPGLADAAATALLIARPKEWRKIAANLGIKHVLRMERNGEIHTTDAMASRLQFSPTLPVNPTSPP